MNREGDFGWEQIGKILIVLVALIVIIILILTFKEKLFVLLEKVNNILRFR